MNVQTKSLSPHEYRALDGLASIVRRYLKGSDYERAGHCAQRIKRLGLHLRVAATWEAFCPQYLGATESRVKQLIRGTRCAAQMRAAGTRVPLTERQARPLVPCTPEERARVACAVEAAGGFEAVTARSVAALCAAGCG